MLQHADSSDIMKKVIMTMPDSSCKLTHYILDLAMSRSLNAECLHNEAVGSMSCNIRASLRRQVWIKHKFDKLKLYEKIIC